MALSFGAAATRASIIAGVVVGAGLLIAGLVIPSETVSLADTIVFAVFSVVYTFVATFVLGSLVHGAFRLVHAQSLRNYRAAGLILGALVAFVAFYRQHNPAWLIAPVVIFPLAGALGAHSFHRDYVANGHPMADSGSPGA